MSRCYARLLRLLPAALVLAACSDRHPVASGPELTEPGALSATRLRCSAVVSTRTVRCAAPGAPSLGMVRPLIVGGQGEYVRLAADSVFSDGAEFFRADVTVQNLMPQPLGTSDGTTGSPIRVFLESGIVTYGGGTVDLEEDSTDFFTGPDQEYIGYAGPLHPRAVSSPRRWFFSLTTPVDSFAFTVLVSGAVPHETGWVSVSPLHPSIEVADSLQLTAEVRDAGGQVHPEAGVAWTSSDDSVATVSEGGLVRGVAPGTVTITATGLGRSGSTQVTVADSVGDAAAPTLVSLSIDPTRVDATSGPRTVEFQLRAFDRESGVDSVHLTVVGPDLSTQVCITSAPLSGTPADGVFRCVVTIPQAPTTGTWLVQSVALGDAAGNTRTLGTAQLREAALPYSFEVASDGPDTILPTLTSFTFSPRSIDVTLDSATVVFSVGAADAGSGVKSVEVAIARHITQTCQATAPEEGTEASGVFRCRIEFSTSSASGEWRVQSVTITDNVDSVRVVTGEELEASGFQVTLDVTNPNNDQAAPALDGFSFAPDEISTAAGPANVLFTMVLTDETAVASVQVTVGMDGQTPLTCTATTPDSGTAQSGTYTCTVTFPPGSATGEWSVLSVRVEDTLGHALELSTAELASDGFPTSIVVN